MSCEGVDRRGVRALWHHPAAVEDSTACVKATELSDIHRDLFDRLIVATAIEEDATLATLDSLVRSYPEMRHHLS